MTKHNFMYRPGLCAIAAFAALGATPLLAQSSDPIVPIDTAPAVTSSSGVATPDPVAVPTVDPLAASTIATTAPGAKPSATKVRRTATRTVARTTSARIGSPRRATAPVAEAAAVPVAATAPVAKAAPPIADPLPVPTETPIAAVPDPVPVNDRGLPADALPIGAAGLGALALAGAALAMRRCKRRLAEDEFVTQYDEPAFAAEAPVDLVIAEPAPIAAEKPAMAWGTPAAGAPAMATSTEGDGEVPEGIDPTSHVAAAYRGPSDENPSLSLKTRLKRGAFFDQRERQVAAGEAAPLDMTAGLPDAVIDEIPDAPSQFAQKSVSPLLSTGGSYSLRPAHEHA